MPPAARFLALIIVASLSAWAILAWVHFVPWLDRRTKREALLVTMAPQMFRSIGAMAMFPGIANVPKAWAEPLAWGDGATTLLAMLSMVALQTSSRSANVLVWVASIFGLLDMLHNGANALRLQLVGDLGPIAYVVGFVVPAMFALHVLAFRTLLRRQNS